MDKIKYDILLYNDNLENFPGYHVTDTGRIFSRRSVKKNSYYNFWREKKIVIDNTGRCNVSLRDKLGKVHNKRIHRLVLETYLGECPLDMECCHNDGNAQNNNLTNLRWDTSKSNTEDLRKHGRLAVGDKNGSSKLTIDDIDKIFYLKDKGMMGKDIAKICGVNPSCISKILNKKRWKHI